MVLELQAVQVDKGDTAWMLVSTILVLMMILPGLALFYGGLVRTKNMLSILSQVLGITAAAILVWVGWGYAIAFGGGLFLQRDPRLDLDADLHPGCRHSRARLRRLPDDLRGDHRLAHRRRPGGAGEVLRHALLLGDLADHRLRAARPHGLASQRLHLRAGRAGFRRRHRRPHQRRGRRAGRGLLRRQADRFPQGSDSAPFPGSDPGGCRPALGRLVRLQCRLRARGERHGRRGDDQHLRRSGRRSAELDADRADRVRPVLRCSAAPRAASPGSSRSLRPRARPVRSERCCWPRRRPRSATGSSRR